MHEIDFFLHKLIELGYIVDADDVRILQLKRKFEKKKLLSLKKKLLIYLLYNFIRNSW